MSPGDWFMLTFLGSLTTLVGYGIYKTIALSEKLEREYPASSLCCKGHKPTTCG